ncbi:chaperonin 10-like protein [Massariosphaeria phaeospora]|uniref:Chaperonin 10-like protein n=1 Tax=Massariosphaeria phaeospora TaxID=100035 RepID=A0A7C8IGH3_9PLEO|nr:chaperonin 10-like protein [Massariosphaeria phaeospora]
MASPNPLPAAIKALVLETKGSPLVLKDVPTPEPTLGSVVVQVLASAVDKNVQLILSGVGPFTYPLPFVPGGRSVGRVAATGPDTTSLAVGQLVLVEPWLFARDNPEVWLMWGGGFEGASRAAKKLFADAWRDGAYTEYIRAPLENAWPLNEHRLCNELRYTIPDLVQLATDLVAFGGLQSIDLRAGERLAVVPATGIFSAATGRGGDSSALGARVVAVGRKEKVLQTLKDAHPNLVKTVTRTGERSRNRHDRTDPIRPDRRIH